MKYVFDKSKGILPVDFTYNLNYNEQIVNGSFKGLTLAENTIYEIHIDEDKFLHNEEGPSWTVEFYNGSAHDMYYWHGKLIFISSRSKA